MPARVPPPGVEMLTVWEMQRRRLQEDQRCQGKGRVARKGLWTEGMSMWWSEEGQNTPCGGETERKVGEW